MEERHLSNEQRQERLREREHETRLQREADIRLVMSTPAGRRFVSRLVHEFGAAMNLGFNVDPHLSAFNQGQRAVGLEVEKTVRRVAHENWKLMHAERIAADELPEETQDSDD